MCMHTEVEFFFPVNFLSILNIIKEVIIKNKSNNYVSFFFSNGNKYEDIRHGVPTYRLHLGAQCNFCCQMKEPF